MIFTPNKMEERWHTAITLQMKISSHLSLQISRSLLSRWYHKKPVDVQVFDHGSNGCTTPSQIFRGALLPQFHGISACENFGRALERCSSIGVERRHSLPFIQLVDCAVTGTVVVSRADSLPNLRKERGEVSDSINGVFSI